MQELVPSDCCAAQGAWPARGTCASSLPLEEPVGRTVQAVGGYLLPLSPGGDLSSCPRQVLETCVKNCGYRFHVLVANRDFIDSVLVKVISPKNSPPTIVQDKVLALIQVGWWPWASPTASVKAPGPCLPTASQTPTLFWKTPAGWVMGSALGWALGVGTCRWP